MKNNQYQHTAPAEGQLSSVLIEGADLPPAPAYLAGRFERMVQQRSKQLALQSLDGSLSYHELNVRANQVAHFLIAQGVGPDTTVGICLEHNHSMIIGILAVLKAGGCYVPLDPAYPQDRLQLMVSQSGCRLVLTEAALMEELEFLSEVRAYPLDDVFFPTLFGTQVQTNPATEIPSESLAYIIYTSGSTGTPKGTAVTQANVLALIDSGIAGLGPGEKVLCAASPSFDAFTFELWGALLLGGTSVLVSLRQVDFQQLQTVIRQYQVTTAWLTAAVFNQIISSSPAVLSGLNTLLIGGEALSKSHVMTALQLFPQLRLLNGYGPTECTTFTCVDEIDLQQVTALSSVPIGRAIRNVQAYILDEWGGQVQDQATGELYVGGGGVCRGYHRQPALTADSFIPNPFTTEAGQRLYRTGDLVRRLADGKIEYVGRADHQVKIRGFRIELKELENALLAHPAVAQVAVKAWQRDSGEKYLVAYLVLASGTAEDELTQQILLFLHKRLPAYMVPLACVMLAELPLTVNGKVDQRALPAVDEAALRNSEYAAPASPLESQLLALFRQNLGLSQFGVTDSYLALGGDSIKAISLVSAARLAGLPISIRQLFEKPTVRELATLLEGHLPKAVVPVATEVSPFSLLTETERADIVTRWPENRIDDAYPLSQMQQGMVYHAMRQQEHHVYHDIVTYRLSINPSQAQFEQALSRLQQKHPVLRSVFQLDLGRPLQLVLKQLPLQCSWHDLQQQPEHTRQALMRQWVEAEKNAGVEPTTELLRLAVFVLGPQQMQLALSFHHAMWDGWSDAVFVRELVSLCTGVAISADPPPGFQYAVAAESTAMVDPQLQQFWREKTTDIRLPWWSYSKKSASVQLQSEISAATSQQIMRLANELQVQEKSIWASAYLALLSLLDGHAEVCGTIVSHNRPEMEAAEAMLGLFLNPLPVRARLSGQNWQQFIGQVHAELVALYPVRQFPLAAIQRQSGLDFSASLFNYINFHVHQDQDAATEPLIRHDLGFVETNYLLAMSVRKQEDGQRYTVTINADSVVFSQQLCDQIAQYLQNIVQSLTQDLLTPVSRQQLLGAAELSRQLDEWSQSAGALPDGAGGDAAADMLAHELVELQASRSPYAVAVVDAHNHLTYQALNNRANRLAEYLLRKRSGPEARIGLLLPKSVEMAIAVLAVLKAGCVYVPLNPADPAHRTDWLLRDADVEILLTTAALEQGLPCAIHEDGAVSLLLLDQVERQPLEKQYANPGRQHNQLQPQSLAYILYTSGTSGVPKGVMVQHNSLANHCRVTTQMRGFDLTTRNLQFAPLVFDAASAEFLNAFISGSLLHLPPAEVLANHQAFEDYVWLRGINRGYIPPAYLKLLNKARFHRYVSISVGGEAVAAEVLSEWSDLCPVTNAYGPTECTIAATAGICHGGASVSIGKPLPGVQVYIVDEALGLLPSGVAGELCIGGIGVSRGYLNNRRLTAASFVPDPFSRQSGSRLYRTGDKVKWLPDGQLVFLGRLDQQIKLRGQRIEIGEIEQCLHKLGLVSACAVVLQQSDPLNARLAAFVVPSDGQMSDSGLIRRLKAGLRHELPAAMVPDAFAVLPALPLTANGKVNRDVLSQTLTEYVQDDLIEPVGTVEQAIGKIWCEVLQLERIGRHSNFFELGGHSLLATQLFARLRSQLHVDLPFRHFFAAPTIAELAAAVAAQCQEPALALQQIQAHATGASCLSFAQQRLWFLHEFSGPDATYNIPLALQLSGQLDIGVLQRCLSELLARHETLRSRFKHVRGKPQLQIVPAAPVELLAEPVATQADCVRICQQQQSYEFDLANEALICFRLLQQGPQQHLLLITMHHIVADGWSMAILFRELTALYRAFLYGEPSPLPPLPISYSDFASWQQQWLSTQQQQKQLDYWRRQLADLPPLLALPSDRQRPAQQSFRGQSEHFRLSAQLSAQLQQLSDRLDVTLFVTLLSAFSLLLHKHARQNDFAVGVPVANRTQRETEDLIGFFVNTLVMRFDYSQISTFHDLVQQTRNTALDAFEHQNIPFEQLVSELNPQRDLSHSPLFQVMFALQNTPVSAMRLAQLQVQQVTTHEFGVSRYDLTLYMSEDEHGLSGTMEYSSDLFDAASIQALVQQFTHLLSELVSEPQLPVAAGSLLSATMLQQQQRLWCGQPALPAGRLEQQFAAIARKQPDAPALRAGEQLFTFSELETEASRLAQALQQRRSLHGSRVGLCLSQPFQLATAMLAVLRAGGSYCILPAQSGAFLIAVTMQRLQLDLLLTASPVTGTQLDESRLLSLDQLTFTAGADLHGNEGSADEVACLTCSADWTRLSHQHITQLLALTDHRLLSLWDLDAFSATCWWSWLRELAADASAVAPQALVCRDLPEIPVMPAGLAAQVSVQGAVVALGGTGTLQVALTDCLSAAAPECWRDTGLWVRANPGGSFSPLSSTTAWRDSCRQSARQRELQRRVGQLWPEHPLQMAWHRIVGRGLLICFSAGSDSELSAIQALCKQQTPALLMPQILLPKKATAGGQAGWSELTAWLHEQSFADQPAPQGETEILLAGIWAEVLRLDVVGREQNFFELGGYSLLVTQVAARIAEVFQLVISVKSLFEYQTVHDQASLIQQLLAGGGVSQAGIPRAQELLPAPLSFAQQRLWFLSQLMGPSAVYNIPLVLSLKGDLMPAALEACLQTLMARHESLQTRLFVNDGEVVQVIGAERRLRLNTEIIMTSAELQQICQQEREYQFDLVNESLCRVRLLRQTPQQHYLLITMHHMITDGWSTDLLLKELQQLYRAYVQGLPSPLAPLPIRYSDFARWQRQVFDQTLEARQVAYWQQQLAGLPPMLELPTDFIRPAEQRFQGSVKQLTLSAALSKALKALSRQNGTTLFTTLIAAYSILLSRYSRQTDLAIGTPVSNRTRRETEGVMGFFLNSLVFRFDLSKNLTFEQYLRQVQETALNAYQHQDLPFEQLVEELNPQRSLSHSPLFQVSFSLLNNPVEKVQLEGLELQVIMPDEGTSGVSRYDITFNLVERSDQIVGAMEYNSELFSADTIARMQHQYIALLQALVAQPQLPLHSHDMMDDHDRTLLLKRMNPPTAAYPANSCVHELFSAQARRTPDAIALNDRRRQLTYRQLEQRANQLAHCLRGLGIGPEVCVGICSEPSVDMMVGLLAVLKSGGYYLVLDPTYPPARLQYMLEQSNCQLILSERSLLESMELLQEQQILLLESELHDKLYGRFPTDAPVVSAVAAHHLAYIIYTSGSTGKPKGVMISHQNITSLVCSGNAVQPAATDVVAQASNPAFDAVTYELWGALLNGAQLLLIDKATLLAPANLAATLQQERVTILFITTALFNRIIQHTPEAFSKLRQLLFGGEAFSAQTIETALTNSRPQQLHHVYGPTECTTYATSCLLQEQVFMQNRKAPIGLPLTNKTAYVLNGNVMAAIGTLGELCIGGAGLARGYMAAAALTAEKFVPNPFAEQPGERLYRTGDLVRLLADGNIEFVGRLDHQVKIRGFRLELGEIEAAIAQHPAVKAVIVVVRQTQTDDRYLVAYLVPHDRDADHNQFRTMLSEYLQDKIPEYAVPRAMIVLPQLPLNHNGKVDRSALPEPEESTFARASYVAASSAAEEVLVDVWQQVLGVQNIGVEDNFFAVGGDSIRSISIVTACRARGMQLAVKDLFVSPTIRALAKSIRAPESANTYTEQRLEAFSLLSAEESQALLNDIAAEDFEL